MQQMLIYGETDTLFDETNPSKESSSNSLTLRHNCVEISCIILK
jgi:hypothetical protein